MTDIYSNTTPWGRLDDATREAFRWHVRGSRPLDVWTADGWVRDDSVEWDNGTVYRAVRPQVAHMPQLEPEPVVMTEARKAEVELQAKRETIAAREARLVSALDEAHRAALEAVADLWCIRGRVGGTVADEARAIRRTLRAAADHAALAETAAERLQQARAEYDKAIGK